MNFYAYILGYTIVNCQHKMYSQRILTIKLLKRTFSAKTQARIPRVPKKLNITVEK